MINIDSEPMILAKDEELKQLFANAVREAAAVDLARRAAGKTTISSWPLDRILENRLNAIGSLDEDTIRAAFNFFEAYSGPDKSKAALDDIQAALMIEGVANTQLKAVNRWLKFVFYRLWTQRAFLFPIRFYANSSFSRDELREILPAVATCHFDNPNREFASLGLRITLASDWREFADFDIDVWGQFTVSASRSKALRDRIGIKIGQRTIGFTTVLKHWAKAGFGNGFPYAQADIDGYFYWVEQIRLGMQYVPPSRFIPRAKALAESKRKAARERWSNRRAAAQLEFIDHHAKDEAREQLLAGETNLPTVKLQALARQAHFGEVPIDYFRFLRTKGARTQLQEAYPERMQTFPVEIWDDWDRTFDRYFMDRAIGGYERTNGWDSLRYAFRDYLACYLPWWNELNPEVAVTIPPDPSEFRRYGFWIEGRDDRIAPLPLLRFWDRARGGSGADGFNSFINDCFNFLEYCRGHAAVLNHEHEEFVNPVVPEVDQRRSPRRSKTNKDPIPKAVLPYLLRYAYAAERFFMALQDRALKGDLTQDDRRRLWRIENYETDEWGIPVSFDFDGRLYEITSLPAFPTWETRWVSVGTDGTQDVYLPHISSLRMVISALETGVRFQGIQWLCRKTFNSLYSPEMADAALVPLIISTDKVKDKPWKTLVVRRVHDLLLREERFQARVVEPGIEALVNYEQREHTRFAPVLPLFRGSGGLLPVSDKTYVTAWERLLIGFSQWYQKNVEDAEPLNMYWFEPDRDPLTNEPRVEMHFDGEDSRECCPLRLRFKHSPHSARSTFITARSGVLPIEITMELVGQTNRATTHHYTVESEAEIGAKIQAAADLVWAPAPSNPVHIRADHVNSALRQSFLADRSRTETAFGFQTLSLLNEDVPDLDGVQLLRSTPMGKIVFRETHICPVGEQCPSDVMGVIGEPRRCGLCPLAVKCVDHVTAIAAKERMLLEQVRDGGAVVERMRRRKEPEAAIGQVQDRRRLDVLECQAWRTTRQILEKAVEELETGSADTFLVGMPEAVALHLRHVAREPSLAEFIIERIGDSRAYTSFETPTLRAQAAQLRQRLLVSEKAIDAELEVLEADPVEAFVASLKVALDAHGIKPTFDAAIQASRSGVLRSAPQAPLLVGPMEA